MNYHFNIKGIFKFRKLLLSITNVIINKLFFFNKIISTITLLIILLFLKVFPNIFKSFDQFLSHQYIFIKFLSNNFDIYENSKINIFYNYDILIFTRKNSN